MEPATCEPQPPTTYSLGEKFLLVNCWFCAIALQFPASDFRGGAASTALLVIVNSVFLTAMLYWMLSRRGRTFSPFDVNFVIPVSLYAVASLVSVGKWLAPG